MWEIYFQGHILRPCEYICLLYIYLELGMLFVFLLFFMKDVWSSLLMCLLLLCYEQGMAWGSFMAMCCHVAMRMCMWCGPCSIIIKRTLWIHHQREEREAFPGIMHLHREAVWRPSTLESGELASHQTSYWKISALSNVWHTCSMYRPRLWLYIFDPLLGDPCLCFLAKVIYWSMSFSH
jgi:hypothetical protein